MNLLFDFITLRKKTGAGEYLRRVFFEVQDKVEREQLDIKLFALHDTTTPVVYEDMTPDAARMGNVQFLDVHQMPIDQLIRQHQIDRFFIGCAQYVGDYPEAANIDCEVICVTHDLSWEEKFNNHQQIKERLTRALDDFYRKPTYGKRIYLQTRGPIMLFCRWLLSILSHGYKPDTLNKMETIMQLYHRNPKVQMVVVSNYTKYSMMNDLKISADRIKVLYSPERLLPAYNRIENELLAQTIASKCKYYLFVSANRAEKNPQLMMTAFRNFAATHPDAYILTLGITEKKFDNHIPMPFLSDEDLSAAYANCYALVYPTLFEGFGYPPVEAMRYGKPVLASYCTSIPEVLGDSAIYFSPLYVSEAFRALHKLNDDNYKEFADKSLAQYQIIHGRQESDLAELLSMITR